MKEFRVLTSPKYRDIGFWAKIESLLQNTYDNEGYVVLRNKQIYIGFITPIGKDKISFTLHTKRQNKSFKYGLLGHIHFYKATRDFSSITNGELICSGIENYIDQIKELLEPIIESYYRNFSHGGRP